MEPKTKKILASLLLILIAVISATFVADKAASPLHHQKTIDSIDDKAETVLELVAASTLVSAGLSAIPDDTATPIAEKLADFAEYFLLVMCVLYTEKYLLTLVGSAVFRFLIPAAALLLILSFTRLFERLPGLRRIGVKIAVISLALYMITPLSVRLSDKIYVTYHASIDEIISSAENLTEETSLFDDSETDWSSLASGFSAAVTKVRDKASQLLNNFVEVLAVLIVTSCVIPVLVLLFFLWLIRSLTGIDIAGSIPRLPGIGRKKPIRDAAQAAIQSTGNAPSSHRHEE